MKASVRNAALVLLASFAGGCSQMKSQSTSEPEHSYVFLPGRAADWADARWISPADAREGTGVFYGHVGNAKDVKRAVLTASGLGVFNVFVNSTRVGDEILKSGLSRPYKTAYSFAYDVTPIFNCAAGATNEISAMVSPGWRDGNAEESAGNRNAFIAVLEMTYLDGTKKRFVTDTSWTAGVGGAVVRSGIPDGEWYDARRTAVDVKPAVVSPRFKGAILPKDGASVYARRDLARRAREAYVWKGVTCAATNQFGRVVRLRDCTNSSQIDLYPGETLVIDFGQNAASVPRIRAVAKPGTTMTILPAEELNDSNGLKTRGNDGPEGSVRRRSQRGSGSARIEYTFLGDGVDSYMPLHTFLVCRYVSVTATDYVKFKLFESIPVTSISRRMERGAIETGRADVNRLISDIYWEGLANGLSAPGDDWMFARSAGFNADILSVMRRRLRDLRDAQRADGSYPYGADDGVVVPWTMWRQYGDTAVLKEHWDSMERFMAHLARKRHAEDASEASLDGKYLGGCRWLADSRMMADMAKARGDDAGTAKYEKMSADALAYVRGEVLEGGRIPSRLRDMPTPALLALSLGLLEDADAAGETGKALLDNIKENAGSLRTGYIGTSILLDTLTRDVGAPDMAYTLLGFAADGKSNFNRRARASVLAWLYETAAGIRPGAKGGFDTEFVLAPVPDPRLGYIRAALRNRNGGTIRSQWSYSKEGKCLWTFTIPAGTKASVIANGQTTSCGPGTYSLEISN